MLGRGTATPLRWCVAACLVLLGMLVAPTPVVAASVQPDAVKRQLVVRDIVDIAVKRKRKARRAPAEEAAAPPLLPGPDDRLVASDTAEALIKPLTPAASYSIGQSVFFEIAVRRRQGARAKSVAMEIGGDGVTVDVTVPKGVTVTKSGGAVVLTLPLSRGSRQTLAVEARLSGPGEIVSSPPPVSQLRVVLHSDKEAAKSVAAMLTFPIADCATAYHRALGGIHAGRQATFAEAVRSASLADASLPGTWLFAPRKLAKTDLQPKTAVLLPARRECRWALETVSFSTRKTERVCKRWQLVEVALSPPGPRIPEVDEAEAARLNKQVAGLIANRAGIPAFGKSGKLEWISKRILTDLARYLQQEPHPALCSGVDVMTAYFVDNSVTLRRDLVASAESLKSARRIASTRLAALAMVLGREPELPAETASLSLITPANAAGADEPGAARLIADAGRLLLTGSDRLSLAEVSGHGGTKAMLKVLQEKLGNASDQGKPAAALPYIADALTAVEAVAYLEDAEVRYQKVGEAIFGTISAIEKAHGETCTCAP